MYFHKLHIPRLKQQQNMSILLTLQKCPNATLQSQSLSPAPQPEIIPILSSNIIDQFYLFLCFTWMRSYSVCSLISASFCLWDLPICSKCFSSLCKCIKVYLFILFVIWVGHILDMWIIHILNDYIYICISIESCYGLNYFSPPPKFMCWSPNL